jgi:hypothetical protein
MLNATCPDATWGQRRPQPPPRRSHAKVIAIVAISLAAVGLLVIAVIGLHGSGTSTTQPTQTQPTQKVPTQTPAADSSGRLPLGSDGS